MPIPNTAHSVRPGEQRALAVDREWWASQLGIAETSPCEWDTTLKCGLLRGSSERSRDLRAGLGKGRTCVCWLRISRVAGLLSTCMIKELDGVLCGRGGWRLQR